MREFKTMLMEYYKNVVVEVDLDNQEEADLVEGELIREKNRVHANKHERNEEVGS